MSIHINPKNKGKFNATKKRTGKTTEELTHSKNPLTRKRAIFAQNVKKWKHDDGGYLYTDPPTLLDYLSNYRTLINNNINNNNMYNKFETGGTKRPQYNQEAWHDYFNTQPTDPPYADEDHLFIENQYQQPQNVHYGNVSRYDYFQPNKDFDPNYVPNPNESKLFDEADRESPGDYYGFIPEVEIRAPYNDKVDRYCGDVANQLAQQEGVGDNNNFERLLYIVKDAYSNPDNLDQYGGFNQRGWAQIAQNQMFGAGSHWNKEMSNTGKTFAKAASYLAPLGAALKSGELVPATFSAMSAFADQGFDDIDKKAKEDKKRRYEKRLLNMDDDFLPGIFNTAGSALGFALRNGGILNNAMNRSYFDYGGNIYAPGGEMQMSPEEVAMMQQQGAEGMPAGAEQGMPVPQEGGMPPEMMGGQEQMSQEEMEEQQYEEERRQAFEEAREEAREEGKKTFEFEGRIYVTETGQLVNNEKACGGRLHGYGGNMFAYGGLDGPEPDAFNVGPTDPPRMKIKSFPAQFPPGFELKYLPMKERQEKYHPYVENPWQNPYEGYFEGEIPEVEIVGKYNKNRDIDTQPTDAIQNSFPIERDFYNYHPKELMNRLGGQPLYKNIDYDPEDGYYIYAIQDPWDFRPKVTPERSAAEAYNNLKKHGTSASDFRRAVWDSKWNLKHQKAEGGPLNYDIEEPYPYDEGYTPEQAYQQQQFNDLEAQRREAYNQQIKNRIKERLLREYGITEDELNASRRREVRKKKKSKK